MVKRSPLSFDNEELTKNLKESAGKGLNAFFSPTPSPQNVEKKLESQKETHLQTEIKQDNNEAKMIKINKKTKQESNIANNIVSNITILQFTDNEIEELREPAYKAQTFRLTERETEWVKDTSYHLSKDIKHGKISQADILRISFKLFEKLLENNKADLLKILQQIK